MGAEALLRWRHPVRGILAPGAFIETLAESAIAAEVGRWIIRTACDQAAAWRAMGLPLARVAVNLFPNQAHDDALPKDVEEALAASGLPPEALDSRSPNTPRSTTRTRPGRCCSCRKRASGWRSTISAPAMLR